MRDAFGKYLLKLTEVDDRIYVIDGDLANSTKLEYIARENPSRFIQAGIAEQNMVGVAAGLATTGFQPWVCTFTSFLTKRALDQIIVSVAQPNLNVKLIGSYSGLLNSKTGKTHQGIEDIAIMRTIPNMVILCPADGEELEQMMAWANNYDGPVYIRLARQCNPLFSKNYQWRFNLPEVLYDDMIFNDITIISTGTHTWYAQHAVLTLKSKGLRASLIHVPTINPINKEEIIHAAKRTNCIVTVEDAYVDGGLGGIVSEILSEYHPTHIKRIGIKGNIESGDNKDLLNKYNLDVHSIINTSLEFYETISNK